LLRVSSRYEIGAITSEVIESQLSRGQI
jgi:hypothetical protein